MTRSRTGRPATGGIPFKACLFFAANPGRELSTSQIAALLDFSTAHVCSTLSAVVNAGFLSKRLGGWRANGDREETRYFAGPRILEVIGIDPPEAAEVDDAPIVKTHRPAGTWERKNARLLAPATWMEVVA